MTVGRFQSKGFVQPVPSSRHKEQHSRQHLRGVVVVVLGDVVVRSSQSGDSISHHKSQFQLLSQEEEGDHEHEGWGVFRSTELVVSFSCRRVFAIVYGGTKTFAFATTATRQHLAK